MRTTLATPAITVAPLKTTTKKTRTWTNPVMSVMKILMGMVGFLHIFAPSHINEDLKLRMQVPIYIFIILILEAYNESYDCMDEHTAKAICKKTGYNGVGRDKL